MRYLIDGNIEIRSENAALSENRKSKYFASMLLDMGMAHNVLDFGCGKLRYIQEYMHIGERLTVVDSHVQIYRNQKIHGARRSVADYVRHSNSVRALSTIEFAELDEEFDLAFCVNVLSSIPCEESRRTAVRSIRMKMAPNGAAVFVCQYRNSSFTRFAARSGAKKHLDGFIIKSKNRFSFYGLIEPDALLALLRSENFAVDKVTRHQGSVYMLARPAA
jgi:2-polyprenyl-3-methyl-5-hydroxy-6-metoxy-1,4-benzoquinol methylase